MNANLSHCTSKPQIEVYFNNGVSAAKPWHVGAKDGRCIVSSHGNFSQAETAILHAQALCKMTGASIVVPAWLTAVAR